MPDQLFEVVGHRVWVISGLMTPADGDPNPEHESRAEAPDPAAERPTRLRGAAAGMAEAQAWKGHQMAKGWRKLVDASTKTEASITVTLSPAIGPSDRSPTVDGSSLEADAIARPLS